MTPGSDSDAVATQGQPIELTLSESWALLRQEEVGRIAVVRDFGPDIFPINYLVDHGSIVFRTAEGTKLSGADGHPVAFEVDRYDAESGAAWSVVIKGLARPVRQLQQKFEVFDLPLSTWHAAPKSCFVRIEPDTVTGRRFDRTPEGGGQR